MSKVLTNNSDIRVGAFQFPDRKKPCLCVKKGSQCVVYGHFIDSDGADEFMDELALFLGIKERKDE